MSIDTDVYTALVTTGYHVYPLMFPKDATFPVITYQRVAAPREQAFDRTVGDVQARFQIDSWANDQDSARAAALAVTAAVLALANPSVPVYSLTIENELDFHEPDQDVYRSMVEVLIIHG